jgi:hypothetical protein
MTKKEKRIRNEWRKLLMIAVDASNASVDARFKALAAQKAFEKAEAESKAADAAADRYYEDYVKNL